MDLTDGRVEVIEGSECARPPPANVLRWVDLTSPEAASLGVVDDNLPFFRGWVHSDWLMWAMAATCVALPLAMVGWFKRKNWL